MDTFAYSRELVNDELAELRYQASIRPGFQESFSAMFPAPRQRWVDALVSPEEKIRELEQQTLIIHGREDQVIPMDTSLKLLNLLSMLNYICLVKVDIGHRLNTVHGSLVC